MPQDPLTLSRIEAAAPDQSSLNAARKLLVDGKWPSLEHDAERRLLWGACQGSGASAYRVAVEVADLGAKCSCPSRKLPCKHSLALMWWFAERADRFAVAAIPEWVTEWQSRRRRTPGSVAEARAADETRSTAAKSARAAVAAEAADDETKPRDPEAAARHKERARAAREASIAQGLDELDLWIGDQVDRGLGAFGATAVEQCRLLAQRLVDAKAGGLANQIDNLPTLYFSAPEARRHDLLLEHLGALHLLAQAYRRQALLDAALVSDVRSRVGWTMTREELASSSDALRVRAHWTVLATRREAQPDNLVRYETYLAAPRTPGRTGDARGIDDGDGTGEARGVRIAMLLDFVPATVAATAGSNLVAGTLLDAELVYYPSATPLRAIVVAQDAGKVAARAPGPHDDLRGALECYDELLVTNPWLASWPLAFRNARVARAPDGQCWAVARDETCAVPLVGDHAHLLLDLDDLDVYGIFDGRDLVPLAANSKLGPMWSNYA